MTNDTREALAAYAHTAWSEWMVWMFSKSVSNEDGSVTIPYGYYKALYRQIMTPYDALTEREKDADREQADRMLAIIGGEK